MSGDTGRRAVGWPSALRQLKELLLEVHQAAGAPTLDEITADIRSRDLPGAPGRDTVGRILSKPVLPPSQHDAVSVARALAHRAGWDADDLAVRVRDLWVRARLAKGAGRPLEEIRDDHQYVVRRLEVHQALDVDGARDRLGLLPAYIPRAHDARLRGLVAEAKAGHSGIAVLVGGSSTGKTRALWEAVRTLPPPWRLWHPLSSGGPAAVLAELTNVAPRTVVWLNETQNFLESGAEGEQVAAGLRDLLTEPGRGPVLVVATLWTEHWDTLTSRSSPDRHAQARQLLADHKIDVPDAFTPAELSAPVQEGSDARLTTAIRQAQDAQITQYLAGVPVLLDRYKASRGATRALIHAAMDARRLGAGLHIPLGWLVDAAPGYLTEAEYHALPDDWLPQALAYATELCNGTPGILSAVKAGPGRNQRPRRRPDMSAPAPPQQERPGPHYLLADYLDQYSRHHRAETIPPIDFWTAAARHAHPADWHKLGTAAWKRGLYRDAAQLHKLAVAHGTPDAAADLVRVLLQTQPEDTRPVEWAAARISDCPGPVAHLLTALEGRPAQHVTSVLECNPAARANLDSPWWACRLLRTLGRAKATAQMELLAERAAAGIPVDDASGVTELLQGLSAVGAVEAMMALADRAATRFRLAEPRAAARLLQTLHELDAQDHAAIVADRAAAGIHVDDPGPVAQLLRTLQSAGMHSQVAVLAERAAADTPIDSPSGTVDLLIAITDAGLARQVKVVAQRAAAGTVIDNPHEAAGLLRVMYGAGQQHQALALAERAARDCVLKYPKTVAELLQVLQEMKAERLLEVLAGRAATNTVVDYPWALADLLRVLQETGAHKQASLLAEHTAAGIALDDPTAAARFLRALKDTGAHQHVKVLAERAASAPVDDPADVAKLLLALQEVGALGSAKTLAGRAASNWALHDHNAAGLLKTLKAMGAHQHAKVLAERAAASVPLGNPRAVAELLEVMFEVGEREHAVALAGRAAAGTPLDSPRGVRALLSALHVASADEELNVLAGRAAAGIRLEKKVVAQLLDQLRRVGMESHAEVLAQRAATDASTGAYLSALGHFNLFIEDSCARQRFRFGREPEGDAADEWSWDDLK